MGVLLPLGLALKRFAAGFEQRDILGCQYVGAGPQRAGAAVAGVDAALDVDGGDQGCGGLR
jgi:hypothetical protein